MVKVVGFQAVPDGYFRSTKQLFVVVGSSILQPAIATDKPVVGVAITATTAVPGSATGASHPADTALAVAFYIETAKAVGAGRTRFHDADTVPPHNNCTAR
jgi:hypothetical protein